MGSHNLAASLLALLPLLSGKVAAQQAQCATLADGCSAGTAHDAALRSALARFEPDSFYGVGSDPVVFSSFLQGNTLAQIAYSCRDGSRPPPLTGSAIRTLAEGVLSCPNQCGSIPVSGNSNCGVGILVAEGAESMSCFSRAINAVPAGIEPFAPASVGTFSHLGCYTDSIDARVLSEGFVSLPNMTIEACTQLAQGFRYAGLEYSIECHWGNTLAPSQPQPEGCNMPCGGQPLNTCGDGNQIAIYFNRAFNVPAPTTSTTSSASTPIATIPPVSGWVSSVGDYHNPACYVDSTTSRTLRGDSLVDDAMTVEMCVEFARAGQWRYAGVEYGIECFVGNTIRADDTSPPDNCQMPCSGNAEQVCGDGNRVLVYTDRTWLDPTKEEMLEITEAFNKTVAEAKAAIRAYHDALDVARAYVESVEGEEGELRKRSGLLDPESIPLLTWRSSMEGVSSAWETVDRRGTELTNRAVAAARAVPDRPVRDPVVREDILQQITRALSEARRLLRPVFEDASRNLALLRNVANGLPVNFRAAMTLAWTAFQNFGIPATWRRAIFTVSGIFAFLATAIEFFGGTLPAGPDGQIGIPPPIDPTEPTPGISISISAGPTPTASISQSISQTTASPTSSESSEPTACALCDCILKGYQEMPEPPEDDESAEAQVLALVDRDFRTTVRRNPNSGLPPPTFDQLVRFEDAPPGTVARGLIQDDSIFGRRDLDSSIVSNHTVPEEVDVDDMASPNLQGRGVLEKRYGSCQGSNRVSYTCGPYRPTAKVGRTPTANNADGRVAITKWIDYGLQMGAGAVCPWALYQYTNRVPGQQYATEHVYERHMPAHFVNWLQFGDPDSEPIKILTPIANCTVIRQIFGRRSTTPGSSFATQTPMQAMGRAITDNTREHEFFILNADLNGVKTVILSHNQDTDGIPNLDGGSWEQLYQKARYVSLVFEYMRIPAVAQAWHDTNDRMRLILTEVDNDPTYPPPPPHIRDGMNNQYAGWTDAYDEWMAQFLTLKEFKMQRWIQNAMYNIAAGIIFDGTLASTYKTQMVAFLLLQRQIGGFSDAAISFGARYNGIMQPFAT